MVAPGPETVWMVAPGPETVWMVAPGPETVWMVAPGSEKAIVALGPKLHWRHFKSEKLAHKTCATKNYGWHFFYFTFLLPEIFDKKMMTKKNSAKIKFAKEIYQRNVF